MRWLTWIDMKRSYMRSLPWSRLAESRGVLQPPCLFINCCGFLLWAQRKSGIIILPRSADSSPFARYQTVQTLLLRTRLSSHRFWGDCEQKARRGQRTQLWASGKRAWTQRDKWGLICLTIFCLWWLHAHYFVLIYSQCYPATWDFYLGRE